MLHVFDTSLWSDTSWVKQVAPLHEQLEESLVHRHPLTTWSPAHAERSLNMAPQAIDSDRNANPFLFASIDEPACHCSMMPARVLYSQRLPCIVFAWNIVLEFIHRSDHLTWGLRQRSIRSERRQIERSRFHLQPGIFFRFLLYLGKDCVPLIRFSSG
jgi:hypothetical protein